MTGMETPFERQAKILYEDACRLIQQHLRRDRPQPDPAAGVDVPEDFRTGFFLLIDKVSLNLLEDKDNFFGYFLFQMSRDIRFDISSPTAVTFKGSSYVIHFNPVIFLTLTMKQMESSIRHEILHIVSGHLIRAREFKTGYHAVAVNMAMDVVVNAYLDYLPPYATTLEWVNLNYDLKLLPFESFEYYVEKLQTAVSLLEVIEDDATDGGGTDDPIETRYDPAATHDIWEESDDTEEQTLRVFTAKFIDAAQKGGVPDYIGGLTAGIKGDRAELPWNLFLKRSMGSVESRLKKTVTRRNRRQPERLDLRGQLRDHKAKIAVALDISGSISDAEFERAIREVFSIVKNYNHELTVIECDSEIRRVYKVRTVKDIKERIPQRGGTRFTPVIEYANTRKIDLLVYFTDGRGEEKLLEPPRGYQTLWVMSGKDAALSLKEPYGTIKRLKPGETQPASPEADFAGRDGYSMNNQEKMHL